MMATTEGFDSEALTELLALAGRHGRAVTLEDCPGGGNNRVFLLRAGTERYLVKWYFAHPSDVRDRRGAEYGFLQYARRVGCRQVPEPLSTLPDRHLALYEYVPGTKLSAGEIRPEHVDQAAAFFLALNVPDRASLARTLPEASEARFSLSAHIETVRARVARLSEISGTTPEDDTARDITQRIEQLFDTHVTAILREARSAGFDTDAELPEASRCVSPSDFGFHNVLARPSGELCFLDFEYAGWDDPAKMVNDFFWQPAVPVPRAYYPGFLERCVGYSDDPPRMALRTRILMPIFGIKWCCIVLNEFMPAAARRRRFANADFDPQARKRAQLVKVRGLIESLSH